jgi:hypothetical protein
MIYTVPWFPELATFRTPEMPGPAVEMVLWVASYIQRRRTVDADRFFAVMAAEGFDEMRCRKTLWVADRLGLLSVVPALTAANVGRA